MNVAGFVNQNGGLLEDSPPPNVGRPSVAPSYKKYPQARGYIRPLSIR